MSYIGKIPANAVLTTADLADGIVTAAKIEDGTVVAAEIASNAVTTDKINADAVTTAKITDANVTQGKIADQAINEAKMQISNAPTNGYMLTAQSGNTGGLTWVEAGGGKILQVVQGTDTNFRTTTSGSYASLTLNASITPASASNKILVIVAAAFGNSGGNAFFDIQKSTDGGSSYSSLGGGDGFGERIDNAGFTPGALMTLNGAGTTNAINYKIFGKQSGGVTAKLGAGGYSVIMLLEVAA